MNHPDPLLVIADRSSSREAVVAALARLGPVEESPGFWAEIANRADYSEDQRRRAVFELFLRHVNVPITLQSLAGVLDGPTWLDEHRVHVVDRLGGKIPVRWTPEDTIFVLEVLPGSETWMLFLRVAGRLDISGLVQRLHGKRLGADFEVLEYGLAPPDPAIA